VRGRLSESYVKVTRVSLEPLKKQFSDSASENNANMNPFNPAKSFDITHKVSVSMKEETLYYSLRELFL
jgi:hypothetical protein